MLTRAAAAAARALRLERARMRKARIKAAKKKASKPKKVDPYRIRRLRCCACDTPVLSWRRNKSYMGNTTISEKRYWLCRHQRDYSGHYDEKAIAMCKPCMVRFYRDDYVSGKILWCFGPGCIEQMMYGGFTTAKDRDEREKNLPDSSKNPLSKDLVELRAKGKVQRCPGCGMVCERTIGCDHMTCAQCSTHFSYDTGEACY